MFVLIYIQYTYNIYIYIYIYKKIRKYAHLFIIYYILYILRTYAHLFIYEYIWTYILYCFIYPLRNSQGTVEGLLCPILKIEKKLLWFWKRPLLACIYKLNFHLRYGFQSILEKKYQNFYLQGPLYIKHLSQCSKKLFQKTSPAPKIDWRKNQ